MDTWAELISILLPCEKTVVWICLWYGPIHEKFQQGHLWELKEYQVSIDPWFVKCSTTNLWMANNSSFVRWSMTNCWMASNSSFVKWSTANFWMPNKSSFVKRSSSTKCWVANKSSFVKRGTADFWMANKNSFVRWALLWALRNPRDFRDCYWNTLMPNEQGVRRPLPARQRGQ